MPTVIDLYKKDESPKVQFLVHSNSPSYSNERNYLVIKGFKFVGTITTDLTVAELDKGLAWRYEKEK